MLNPFEMSELWRFQEQMEDCQLKNLLHTVLFEYFQYIECGSVEDCQSRKELCSMSLDEIGYKFNAFVKAMREEVDFIRHKESLKSKKIGRPPKRSNNND